MRWSITSFKSYAIGIIVIDSIVIIICMNALVRMWKNISFEEWSAWNTGASLLTFICVFCFLRITDMVIIPWKRYRNKGVPFNKIPTQMYHPLTYYMWPFLRGGLKEYLPPLQEVKCPYCGNTFQVSLHRKPFKFLPFKVKCPSCARESRFR